MTIAGADGAAALADREALCSSSATGVMSSIVILCCRPASPSWCLRAAHRARHVRRAHVELRAVVGEERRVAAALLLLQHVHLALELRVRRHRARLGQDLTRARCRPSRCRAAAPRCCRPPAPGPAACGTSPRPSRPLLRVSRKPMISTSSPTFTTPRSMRPVATVPRPLIENTSSTAIKNGLSMSRTGSGISAVERRRSARRSTPPTSRRR